jgi:integrase
MGEEGEEKVKKEEKLPRGICRRKESPDSLVVTFALRDNRCGDGHVPDCVCGRVERRSVGPVTVAFAKEQRAIFMRQVREGTYRKRQARPVAEVRHTISDLWGTYLRGYRLAGKRSAWRQEAAWAHLKPKFGDMQPDRLSTASLIAYQEARKAEGASNATINRELSALSAALYNANAMTVENGKPLLAHVPTFPSKLKEAAPRKGFVTDKEYSVLAANCKPLWLRAFIACAYSFGFRRGELLNLRVRQVDLTERWIELEQGTTKNDDARKVKMTSEVFELLRACATDKKSDDYLFTREDGKPVYDPREEWYELSVASGLGQWVPAKRKNGEDFMAYRGLNLHDFRRSAIRNMDRRGVSQTTSMKISGHRTVSVWRRYNIGDEKDLELATAKIEGGRQVFPVEKTDTKTDTSANENTPAPWGVGVSSDVSGIYGGDDETRTRDLCRDRAAF